MTTTLPQVPCREPGCTREKPPHFLVGRDWAGRWVARDRNGPCSGVFATRAQALRFAWCKRGERAGAVVLVPGILEVFEAAAGAASRRTLDAARAADGQVRGG
jgi:hypothetical protein